MPVRTLLFPFTVTILALAGCQSTSSDSKVATQSSASPTETVSAAVQITSSFGPTNIGLYRDDRVVRVGDEWEKARLVFHEPNKGAYHLHDLPPRFGKGFSADGWESNRGEGFGVISYQGSIVAAMYQDQGVTDQLVSDMVALHRNGTAELYPLTITGQKAQYWFWTTQDGTQRLMICAAKGPRGTHLTMAMGLTDVLKAIGVSPEDAKKDAQTLDEGRGPAVKAETPTPTLTPEQTATVKPQKL